MKVTRNYLTGMTLFWLRNGLRLHQAEMRACQLGAMYASLGLTSPAIPFLGERLRGIDEHG